MDFDNGAAAAAAAAAPDAPQPFLEGVAFPFQVGDDVDARDSVNNWYESKVLRVRRTNAGESEYYVHFRGWQPRFDSWVAADAISPLHTRTVEWRSKLRVGDYVEFSERSQRWLRAVVTDVTRDNHKTTYVAVRKESQRPEMERSIWLDVECDKICHINTHVKGPLPAKRDDATCAQGSAGRSLGERLKDLQGQRVLTDMELEVDGVVFPVHRCVLAAGSSVFRAMFTNATRDAAAARIEIPDVSSQTFSDMLRFVYDGRVAGYGPDGRESKGAEVEEWEVMRIVALIVAADRFAVENLSFICESLLSDALTVQNVLHMIALANRFSLAHLKRNAEKFFVMHASDIVASSDFCSLLSNSRPAIGSIDADWSAVDEKVADDPSGAQEETKS